MEDENNITAPLVDFLERADPVERCMAVLQVIKEGERKAIRHYLQLGGLRLNSEDEAHIAKISACMFLAEDDVNWYAAHRAILEARIEQKTKQPKPAELKPALH